MGEEPAHQPRVQAKAAYDDRFLYLIWKVEDKFVLNCRYGGWNDQRINAALALAHSLYDGPIDLTPLRG